MAMAQPFFFSLNSSALQSRQNISLLNVEHLPRLWDPSKKHTCSVATNQRPRLCCGALISCGVNICAGPSFGTQVNHSSSSGNICYRDQNSEFIRCGSPGFIFIVRCGEASTLTINSDHEFINAVMCV